MLKKPLPGLFRDFGAPIKTHQVQRAVMAVLISFLYGRHYACYRMKRKYKIFNGEKSHRKSDRVSLSFLIEVHIHMYIMAALRIPTFDKYE